MPLPLAFRFSDYMPKSIVWIGRLGYPMPPSKAAAGLKRLFDNKGSI